MVSKLSEICIKRISDNLVGDVWLRSQHNPFAKMPAKVVDMIMKAMQHPYKLPYPCISQLSLLISSGQLQCLDLTMHRGCPRHCHRDEYDEMIKLLTRDACKNLKSLTIPSEYNKGMSETIPKLLENCHQLEQLRTDNFFHLGALTLCPNMRSVKISYCKNCKTMFDSSWSIPEFQQFLKNMEVFDVLRFQNGSLLYDKIAKILLWGPKLISMGMIDTCIALDYIREKVEKRQFALKRCCWGKQYDDGIADQCFPSYGRRYPKIIKNSALSCPMVEELVLQVVHQDCLQHLRHLKQLNVLILKFSRFLKDPIPALLNVLQEIGPQLKHLSVDTFITFPVNDICRLCPNLESLGLFGCASVSEPVETCESLRHLQRLYTTIVDEKSLIFLLENCVGIQEMIINDADCFDDEMLDRVLQKNMFSKLKTLYIQRGQVSERKFVEFLETAQQLENVSTRDILFHKILYSKTRFFSNSVIANKPNFFENLLDQSRF
ncbi:uncharacterized protein CEXT_85021 [Caerostris extrusa]|uniref:Uncharacterized protein n=1 Tax=Caerostris extrusa TaxID=172846 RepID=A0AAV4XW37_CAEEX|nr:uncharacterized protein CEXT_85021 [Caerostris extrusa]